MAKTAATVTAEERAAVGAVVEADKAEKAVKANKAPVRDGQKLILQTIPVGKDTKDVKRCFTQLTPSMCQIRGCGFDAAKEIGISAGWGAAPVDQVIDAAGTTLGERIKQLLDLHVNNIHNTPQLDHIVDADDLRKRGDWAPGQHLKL